MQRSERPTLRPVETLVVPDARHGQVLVLRDTQGITDAHAVVPPVLIPIVARFTGAHSPEEIARDAGEELGQAVPVAVVERLIEELEKGLFLEGETFEAARARVHGAFRAARVRPASHAGGAYHADPKELGAYLDRQCLGAARKGSRRARPGTVVGLVAPHIDPWRGAAGYGHAYAELAAGVAPETDTFVIFGTSHAPMREPFALCRKAFETPLGEVPADEGAIDEVAKAAPFDVYADEFNHKREHSLEFQVVFLKHLFKDRPIRIVPVLAGLGEHQARGTDPTGDARASRFLGAVKALVDARPGKVAVVAGADMAHVGPRFGDPRAWDEGERAELERGDRRSLGLAATGDARGFWGDVQRDLETRRVCGLAPIYALLRTLPDGARGEVLHYEQTVDEGDGSVVSHGAVGFYR